MGYGSYVIFGGPHDGEWGGYSIVTTCDEPGCGADIDRGLSYLCGRAPGGDEHGCGGYFCGEHQFLGPPDGGFVCERCLTDEDGMAL